MKQGLWHRSIFSRLVAMFLGITLPIYGLAFFMFGQGLRLIGNEIASSVQIQLNGYMSGLEREIERIKILQYDALNDESLVNLAIRWKTMTRYQQVESMLRLRHRLQTIRNSSDCIADVRAFILPFQRVISAETGVDTLKTGELAEYITPRNLHGSQLLLRQDGIFLSTLHENRTQRSAPLFAIVVSLNTSAFQTAIERFNTYPGSRTVLRHSTSGHLIASSKPDGTQGVTGDPSARLSGDDQENVFVSEISSDYLGWQLKQTIPNQSVHAPLYGIYPWLAVFSLTALVVVGLYAWYTYHVMHKPLRRLVHAFREVEQGNFGLIIPEEQRNEFSYLYVRFNEMARKLQALINQVVHQRMLMQQAELKQLQTQINPHFLYNSFFILHTMVRTGDEQILPFTRLLGDYFRYITRSGAEDVPLREEIAHAQSYAEIQQIRFAERLHVKFGREPSDWSDVLVPRLILQPIIENAFEHGIVHKTSGGVIRIAFAAVEEVLTVTVEDNGLMTPEKARKIQEAIRDPHSREITGLTNIHRRIQLIYGTSCGLTAEQSELGGLRVSLRIHKRREHPHVSAADRG